MMQNGKLPNGWKRVTAGDVKAPEKGSIVSGPFGSNIGKRFFVEDGVPVIRGNNLTRGDKRFIDDGFVYITEEKAYELRNCKTVTGDIIFTAAGTLGQVALIPEYARYQEYVISNKQLRLRCDREVAYPDYLYYRFSSPDMRSYIANQNTGASIPLITLGILRSLPVNLPPLPTQRRIASILSAYDDLIENNTRRIKLLEQMAQAIYREWFVEFRAPGVKLRPATSEEQKVTGKDRFPVGWELQKTTDGVWVNPPTKVPKDGDKPFIPMSSLPTDSMLINDIEYRTGNSGSKFKNGDTLFARITPCLENGKTAYVQFLPSDEAVAFGSTEFIVLRSKTLCPELVYLMARSDEFCNNAIKSMTGATGRQRVQEACFDRFFYAHPGDKIISTFAEIVSPMFSAVHVLAQKNANLRQTHDLLLSVSKRRRREW